MTARKRLIEYALGQHGLVTTRQARGLDVPVVELVKLAMRGALDHRGYGLYRVNDAPVLDPDAARYAEAVLRVGEDAFLTHDAVLAFHDLALVNPTVITVGTFNRVRRDLPEWVKLVHRTDLTPEDITMFDGIRMTRVAQALIDCAPTVMAERLRDATHDAYARGLILRRERDEVIAHLDATVDA